MGTSDVEKSRGTVSGVTLLETLVALLILGIIAVGLLQFSGYAITLCARTERQAGRTIQLWNQTRVARIKPPAEAESFRPFPDARPLYRTLLTDDGIRNWEVLCAEK